MTRRTVPAWQGKSPDTAIPPRVRLRVIERQDTRCAHCGRKLGVAGERIDIDHITALANGGEHAETNLQALCAPCHKLKTGADVAEKAKVDRVRKKHLGLTRPKATLAGSKASKWKRKLDGTTVRRDG